VFFIGMKRETVKLYHADGDVEVEVQDLTQELEAGSARAELVRSPPVSSLVSRKVA
jgi:hypothetical protein